MASDNFHQLRAVVARGSGLEAQSLGCRSYWLLGPGYWAREVIAVAAAWGFRATKEMVICIFCPDLCTNRSQKLHGTCIRRLQAFSCKAF